MKTLLAFSITVLVSSSVNGQIKENGKLGPDPLILEKTEGFSIDLPNQKPVILSDLYSTKDQTVDPFVLAPYRDTLTIKAVDIPNAYLRSADKSVDIPTYSLKRFPKSSTRPIEITEPNPADFNRPK